MLYEVITDYMIESFDIIDEYQIKAVSLALYSKQYKTIYPCLGLCGESGEVAEKLIPFLLGAKMTQDQLTDIKLEIGDVLWYLATTAHDIGMKLSECISLNLGDTYEKFRDAQDKSVTLEFYNSKLEIVYSYNFV